MKTRDLTGADLDRAVAMALCVEYRPEMSYDENGVNYPHEFSESWDQAGPLIEHYSISLIRCDDDYGTDDQGFCNNVRIPVWCAAIGQQSPWNEYESGDPMYQIYVAETVYGPTPLVAAMRAFVLHKLGEEVELL
jgi:hypothetical protein